MPTTNTSIADFLANYKTALERHEQEWSLDEYNPDKGLSKWTATKCFNADGKNEAHFRSIDFYMLRSNAVLSVIVEKEMFKLEKEQLPSINRWIQSEKSEEEQVPKFLSSKFNGKQIYIIKGKVKNRIGGDFEKLTENEQCYLDIVNAYAEEYKQRIISFLGFFYTDPKEQENLTYLEIELDRLFERARIIGLKDEFPTLTYVGTFSYLTNGIFLNLFKEKGQPYANIVLFLQSNREELSKQKLIVGSMEMSIPKENKRVTTYLLLCPKKEVALPLNPEKQSLIRNILQKLNLTRYQFKSTINPKATPKELLNTAGFDISFLENFVGVYFGYQMISKAELEVFIFRLYPLYYGIFEHSSLLMKAKKYYCTITPISKPHQRIAIDVLHSENSDPLLRFFINMGKERDFTSEKIFMTQLNDAQPKSANIILEKLCDNPAEKYDTIKAEVLNIPELVSVQDQRALNKLLP